MPFLARSLGRATLRANRAFVLSRVSPPAAARKSPARSQYVAALRPASQRWLGVRAVDPTIASLFRALAKPNRVPDLVRDELGRSTSVTIATLVLDGILEIDSSRGFVSGADAHDVVFTASKPPAVASTTTSRLSMDALRYASALPIDDADRLSARLYFYNRQPATDGWRRLMPDAAATDAFLRLSAGTRGRATLERFWRQRHAPVDADDWSAWRPKSRNGTQGPGGPTFKVYVSPRIEHAADAVHAVIAALADVGPAPFKFGGGLYGLLRPDKLVAYFDDRETMLTFVESARGMLDGIPAHGVPFTAGLTDDGLISWGLDPADDHLPWAHVSSHSWRTALGARLARSLIIARHQQHDRVDPVQFAIDRMSLDGVDSATWAPRSAR